jgi:protein SCO1/2
MNTKLISVLLAAAGGISGAFAGESVGPADASALVAGAAAAACCAPAAETKTPKAAAACCAVEVKPAVSACCAEIASAAPLSDRSLYQLEAKWTDDSGKAVELSSLRGRPVVIAMFFASCTYACPVLVDDIKRLRSALPADVQEKAQMVLVSFDTVRDTPVALNAFRERSALDDNWTLLRGEPEAVQDLAMLLGVKFKKEASGQFAHSNLVTVLNAEGEIAHQRNGLMGDMSEAAKAVELVAR